MSKKKGRPKEIMIYCLTKNEEDDNLNYCLTENEEDEDDDIW